MAQILIRNVPDHVIAYHRAQSASAGLSLEAYMRRILEAQVGANTRRFLEEVDSITSSIDASKLLTLDQLRELDAQQRDENPYLSPTSGSSAA